MEKANLGNYEPSCTLAHGLVNKLAAIVGHCDLLKDYAPEDSECQKRLAAIRSIAKNMADELHGHTCDLEVIAREARKKPPVCPTPVSDSNN